MTNRQLGYLKTMMERREQSNLVREVPEEECQSLPAYGAGRSQTADERWDLIRDLCQKHRGEVREINGSWRYLWTPFPTEDKFFHAQYCLTYEEAKMRTPWTGKPASGGKGAGKPASRGKGKPATGGKGPGSSSDGMPASGGNEENTFLMRDDSGAGHWLREAHKRVHGATHPARREAGRRRYAATARWGWGW